MPTRPHPPLIELSPPLIRARAAGRRAGNPARPAALLLAALVALHAPAHARPDPGGEAAGPVTADGGPPLPALSGARDMGDEDDESAAALVQNIGQRNSSVFCLNDADKDLAQQFTTGAPALDYTVTGVGFEFGDVGSSGVVDSTTVYTVTIRADGSGEPGSSLGALTPPASLSGGVNTWTTAGIGLEPSTSYWVQLDNDDDDNNCILTTSISSEDSGGAVGWSIADELLTQNDASGDWKTVEGEVFKIRIDGTVNLAPATLVFSPSRVSVDEGGVAGYTVALEAAPGAELTVALTSDDEDAATVSPETLSFTPTDWGAKGVTVTGVEDDDKDGETVTITHAGDDVETGTVELTVEDDDRTEVHIEFTDTALEASEGERVPFTVRITASAPLGGDIAKVISISLRAGSATFPADFATRGFAFTTVTFFLDTTPFTLQDGAHVAEVSAQADERPMNRR